MSDSSNKEITFFGTGTSHGVPVMTCNCEVCRSTNPLDKRTRSSLLYTDEQNHILIDCGPDFRFQYLRNGNTGLDAVLLTHIHYDHVAGLDDLRPFSYGKGFDVFAAQDVIAQLRQRIPYYFNAGSYKGLPELRFHTIMPYLSFKINDALVTPLTVKHGRLSILGYRIGNMAYITDASHIPEETIETIKNIDVLVVNSLRKREHPAHMNLQDALDVINMIRPRKALLTHMSHEMGLHERVSRELPNGVELAYDGLKIEL